MTTQHTCGGPVFGRKTPGCPRCDELLAGAAPIVWAGTETYTCPTCYRKHDSAGVCSSCALRAHLKSNQHRDHCTVCTFGDW